jgi:Tfp pilus assembly protein PilZ
LTSISDQSKRQFRRRTVRILVEYRSDTGLRRETATTLGAGGLFIETDAPVAEGSLLKLRFQVSEAGPYHEIEGRVAWSKGIAEGVVGAPGMGVEFASRAACKRLAAELDELK